MTAPNKPDGPHESHDLRLGDASTWDYQCRRCHHTDHVPGGWGKLAEPCPKAVPNKPEHMSEVSDRSEAKASQAPLSERLEAAAAETVARTSDKQTDGVPTGLPRYGEAHRTLLREAAELAHRVGAAPTGTVMGAMVADASETRPAMAIAQTGLDDPTRMDELAGKRVALVEVPNV